MRPGPLSLLFAICLLPAHLHAEEQPSPPAPAADAQARIDALEQRLSASERQREALGAELQAIGDQPESAQLQRLRQENRRLKLQLKNAQAQAPQRLLSEQQTWFAVGAGSALLGVLLGALLRGNRRTRREWIN